MRVATLAAIVLLASSVSGAQTLTIAVDNLAARDALGSNVSAVLNLQIWKTLRKAPWPNPNGFDFGAGTVYWFEGGTHVGSAAEAQRFLNRQDYDMLLWGAAQRYGNGVAVDAYLTAPRFKTALAVWNIENAETTVSLAPPRDIYAFAPILLSSAIVEAYSTPGALSVCTEKTQTCDNSRPVGAGMTARRQEGEWAFIKPHVGEAGWLKTPDIGPGGNDITNFASALLSYGRGDFEQAAKLFRRVAASPTAGAAISADAAGLAAAALSRFENALQLAAKQALDQAAKTSGEAAQDHQQRAAANRQKASRLLPENYIEAEIEKRSVSPFLLQVAAMQALDQATGTSNTGARDHRQRAAMYIRRVSPFLDENDPWLIAALRLAGEPNEE